MPSITEEEMIFFISKLEQRTIAKHDFFVKEGQVAHEMGVATKGAFRRRCDKGAPSGGERARERGPRIHRGRQPNALNVDHGVARLSLRDGPGHADDDLLRRRQEG